MNDRICTPKRPNLLQQAWYVLTASLISEIITNLLVYLRLYSKQFFYGDLKGKVAIVTGGNRGIGRSIVEQLTRKGARVIIACRDVKAGEQVASELNSKRPSSDVSVAQVDLSSFKSIKKFASKILANETKVDFLVNNAVLIKYSHEETEDGLEVQSSVATYGPVALTLLLLPKLIESNASVINVSSMFHRNITSLDVNNLNMNNKDQYDWLVNYSEQKVLMHLWSKYLGAKLASNNNKQVRIVCVDPGCAQTDIVSQGPIEATIFHSKFARPLFRTTSCAAASVVQSIITCRDGYEGGKKFHMKDGHFVQPSKVSVDEVLSLKVWQFILPVLMKVVDKNILEEYSLVE